MKKIGTLALILVVGVVLLPADVTASAIGAGTISISTGSDLYYLVRTSDDLDEDYNSFNFDIAGGYFIIDNLEIGFGVYYNREKWKDDEADWERTVAEYGIDPRVIYHLPLGDNLNLYVGAGIGYGKYKDEETGYSDYEVGRFSLRGELGAEFFLNPLIAITAGARYQRHTWSPDDFDDDITVNYFYIPHIGIKLFTTRPVAGE